MKLARPVLAAAAAGLALFSVGAQAAPSVVTPAKTAPTTITDQAGDANGINGEGFATVPAVATGPASAAGADILSISWQTLVKTTSPKAKTGTPDGMKVVMTLSAAPMQQVIYRVTGGTADCTTFWFTYSTFADGKTTSTLQHNCPGYVAPATSTSSTESIALDPPKIEGKTITWTVPKSLLPSGFKVGAQLTGLSGHARAYAGTSLTGGATVPLLDEAAGAGTFTYGK